MTDERERRHVPGLLFVACLFIGGGIGLAFGRPEVGGAIGMGVGFLVMALVALRRTAPSQGGASSTAEKGKD